MIGRNSGGGETQGLFKLSLLCDGQIGKKLRFPQGPGELCIVADVDGHVVFADGSSPAVLVSFGIRALWNPGVCTGRVFKLEQA